MRRFSALILLTIMSMILASAAANAGDEMPPLTFEGLELVSDTGFSSVYVEPGTDFAQYRRINLEDAYVAFKAHWQQRRTKASTTHVSAADMDRIRLELMLLFREIFSRTLQQNGYELTTDTAEDVLQVKPAIINLDVVDPGSKAGDGTVSFSESAGEMTLYLELYDSVSGDIIARVFDRQKDRQTGYVLWESRISNRAAARRILQLWANTLGQGLDEARRASTSG